MPIPQLRSKSRKYSSIIWSRSQRKPPTDSGFVLAPRPPIHPSPSCFHFHLATDNHGVKKQKQKKGAQFSALQALKKMTAHVVFPPPHTHTRSDAFGMHRWCHQGLLTVESRYPPPFRSFNSNVNKNKSRIKRVTAAPVGVGGVLDGC